MSKQNTNIVILIGRLGHDPETKQVGDSSVTNFTLAVNHDTAKEKHTNWFDIVAWGRLSDLASQFLSKGREVAIRGRLHQRNFTRKDGSKGSKTEVVAEGFEFLGSTKNKEVDEQESFEVPF